MDRGPGLAVVIFLSILCNGRLLPAFVKTNFSVSSNNTCSFLSQFRQSKQAPVMEISQLYIYPIKSLREVAVPEAVLTSTGFEYDRRFMLLKVNQGDDGVETLQNMHVPHFPEMSLFLTDIVFPTEGKKNGKIIVTYRPPGVKDNGNPQITTLEVPLEPDVQGLEELTVTMHQSPTRGYHMGSKYNDWFSQCFGYKVVLVYLGPHWRRVLGSFPPGKSQAHREQATPLVSKRSATVLVLLSLLLNIGVPLGQREISSFTLLVLVTITVAVFVTIGANRYGSGCGKRKEERITFADTAPYLMISETSVDNVSARLAGDKAMDLRKTRPNIVISGARTAFEEDFWAELMSLNVDYMTGKMGTGDSGNILKKLMKDRRVDKGARFSPVFGRYVFLDRDCENASIRVGEEVTVSRRVEERTTYDWPGLTN
ncbi:hypothetical protein RU639_011156 [Aspergillus parasiticus]